MLPFNNLSPLAENAFFAAGIHEDILLQLSKLPDLIVTSRNSTLMYAENRPPAAQIARQLGVTYLMDGSVRRDGDAVRISVQLIEAASDRQIWAENFDRELNDIFEIQLEVAEAVAEALQVRLLRTADADHRLPNVVAYERFLAARSVAREFTAEAAALSIKRYREALDIDASYGNAWAGMSIVYSDARFTGLAIDDYNNKALEAAQKALQLSPDEWLPNYAMAYYLSSMDVQRFDAARPFFDKALARNPNNAEVLLSQGNALIWAGRGFEAIESYRKSYRRNPKDENAVVGAAVAAAIAGESERAEALIQEFIALAPDNVYLHVWAGSVYNWMNHWESAVDAFAHALELDPGNVGTMIWLGAMFTAVDDHEAAEYWLDRAEPIDPENEDLAFNRSDFLMAAGRTEEAIAQADQWYARHPGGARAKLFKGYGYALKARQAWGREEQQGWHENLQLQLDYLLSFIRDRDVTGENGVQFFSGWATLSAAQAAALLGDQPLSDELPQRVIDYHQEQPPGITMFSANQLGIAHAALGDRDKAIDYFRTAHEEGHHRFFVLANINLDSGIYDMYGNIHNDIAFKEIVAGEAENNAELRARTRARHPQLFPDTM